MLPGRFDLDNFFGGLVGSDNGKMACDIYEKEGIYHLEMDLPGFSKEDIKIDCDNGTLTISAEKSIDETEEGKQYLRRERSIGKYSRTFALGEIDENNIDAEFKNGTLKITIPKSLEKETRKTIEIK